MTKAPISTYSARPKIIPSGERRIMTLFFLIVLCFVIIGIRLFYLQVIKHGIYSKIAEEQHFGAIDLPARRGEILVRDPHSGELSKLATNTTLNLLYVDPLVADDKPKIAEKLAPLLFTKADYDKCLEDPENCEYKVIIDEVSETFLTTNPAWDLGVKKETEKPSDPDSYKTYDEVLSLLKAEILQKISKLDVDFVVLKRDADPELLKKFDEMRLPGIFIDPERFMIYGNPMLISQNELDDLSAKITDLISSPTAEVRKNLTQRKVRYVFLKNKLAPEISRKITELNLKGVVLLPEHWRFYPEKTLASHILGFLNRENIGQYGIEGFFNTELGGKKGQIYAESDPFGRQITVGESKIENAVDGDTLILTIDRVIQKKTEEVLAKAVDFYKADSGQVIIINPFTGAIIAMAGYPNFDPNHFTDSYKLREAKPEEELPKTVPQFVKDEKGKFINATDEQKADPLVQKYIYENKFGPEVFKNKSISENYEPGSTFKPLVMSIGLDSKEVEPQTTYVDDGPLKIDEYEIKNANNNYYGVMTMTQVLQKSLNTGMSFVAKKIGKKLMHKYLQDYGFGQYTDISLEGETKGRLDFYKQWSKAQMLTTSFGQGIVVTPLQLITAWAAIANGGKLVQPYIVDTIIRDGHVIKKEPKVIQRVISEETSSILTSMLVSVIKNYQSRVSDALGILVAGKTGTAQIAGANGRYEKGAENVVTSFLGFFPALKPQYLILVKFDRPRTGENTWGETTSVPVFREIAEYMIDYYNIPKE